MVNISWVFETGKREEQFAGGNVIGDRSTLKITSTIVCTHIILTLELHSIDVNHQIHSIICIHRPHKESHESGL